MPGPKVFVAGQELLAADVNTWLSRQAIVKPADTGRASTTALAADPDLSLTVAASSTYYIAGVIFYDGPSAGSSDLKWSFTVPSGTTGQYAAPHQNLSGAFAGAFQSNWTDTVTANTTGVGTIMVVGPIGGILVTGGNAGHLTLTWAQNTSNATNTHIKAQSVLVGTRIT